VAGYRRSEGYFERIKAYKAQYRIYNQHSVDLAGNGKRSLRASFMKLFVTSKMGLAINLDIGVGKCDGWLQTEFRREMLRKYGSKHKDQDWIWCPVLGKWFDSDEITASQ
jgi:hypothetical protein